MYLAVKDNKLEQIRILLNNKQNELYRNQQELYKNKKQNDLLNCVLDDYNKYRNYIVKDKQEQLNVLEYTLKYIQHMQKNINITQTTLNESNHQQNQILNQISLIKDEISKIVE
tara:strand:- start:15019 stop:15360 length:342 start_codon:yes stop_codon:yes gene_type:complete